jgi:PAS domain S-box-containing protein
MTAESKVAGATSLHELLNDTVDGVFVLDREYRVVSVSEGCERITGCDRGELLGSRCNGRGESPSAPLGDRSWVRLICPNRGFARGEPPKDTRRSLIRRQDGSEVCVETDYTPLYDASGKVSCILGVVRDITEAFRRGQLADTGPAVSGGTAPTGASDSSAVSDGSLDTILQGVEKREILMALRRAWGQRAQAARSLGISRSRLYRRMEALGIDPRVDI